MKFLCEQNTGARDAWNGTVRMRNGIYGRK